MPCIHKLQSELDLELIDYAPTTLIVGTFIPEWPAGDHEAWFYGRTTNNYFWDVLPLLYGEASLINATTEDRKQFCRNKQIAITDLIRSIDDAESEDPEHNKIFTGLSDKAIAYNFDDFNFVNIVSILQSKPSIRNVYLTRGITEAFWKHLWNPVIHYCNRNDLHERKLLTPTADAAYQHEAYNYEHPNDQILRIEDYVLMKWKQEWHPL